MYTLESLLTVIFESFIVKSELPESLLAVLELLLYKKNTDDSFSSILYDAVVNSLSIIDNEVYCSK